MPPVLINHPKSNLGKLFQLVEKGIPIPSFQVGDINQRSFLSYELLAYVLEAILQKGTIFQVKYLIYLIVNLFQQMIF
jgi:hypothetical protein